MKKLRIETKFKYKKEEFKIKMWVSGKLRDDLIKRAEQQIKEGDEVVGMLDRVKKDRDRIYAELGITRYKEGSKKFKATIKEWKRDYPDNPKVQAQIKRLEAL